LLLTVTLVSGIGVAAARAQRQATPLSLWGVRLRAPLDTANVRTTRCMSAPEFAHIGGTYSIIADAALMGAPHQHRDSAVVLHALAPARVCYARVSSGATVIVTSVGDTVTNALFFWPDSVDRPSEGSMLRFLTKLYGRPIINELNTPVWSRDSTGLYLAPQGPYWDGTTITLGDTRACVRYEALVHRYEPLVGPPDSVANRC
jgi:hypothetical protein